MTVFEAFVTASMAFSVVTSGAETGVAGSSSALATAEPSAHAPVTPAAITMERRMFVFIRMFVFMECVRSLDPQESGVPEGAAGPRSFWGQFRGLASGDRRGIRTGGQTCFRPRAAGLRRGEGSGLGRRDRNVPVLSRVP